MKNKGFKSATLLRVLKYAKRHTFCLAVAFVLSVFTVALTLYAPILVGRAIDNIVSAGQVNMPQILRILLEFAVVLGFTGIFQWISGVLYNNAAFKIVKDIRNDAFSHIQTLPVKFADTNSHGDIVSRVIPDVDQLSDGLILGFSQLFSGVLTIIGTFAFMLSISPIITLAVVVFTPLSFFIAKFIAKHTYDMFRNQTVARGNQAAFINEMISNLKTVKALSFEEENTVKFDELNRKLADFSLKATFFSSLVNPSTRFVNSLIYAAVVLLGGFFAVSGSITVGGLSCFLSYSSQFAKPFNEISGVIAELQNAIVCAARIFEVIDEKSETPEAKNIMPYADGNVEMKNISFSYTEDTKLIENLNLSVKRGQRIAIVGPTGCGKTTLINLLMRFYDVNSGKLIIDGSDIREVTRRSLRKNFGMVLQETWLKDATVAENIAYGAEDATTEEIVAAAKAAYADDFIRRMPNGYNTIIEAGGTNLSAGQRQLLCIARVMLVKPPILILDEATSSIDTRTELKIQNAFSALMEGRTSFIVAHRLSTIRSADKILVMNNGNIVEQGTHDELLDKKGFYYNLYNSQFETV